MINLSSRNLELIIGDQNWTAWIDANAGIQIGYGEYELGSGLMLVQGTIALKFSRYGALPSVPNYRLNPAQWKRGQTVSIRIANTSGALTHLPCSGALLYLLKPAQPPKYSSDGMGAISLDIGCRLNLNNFPPEPSQNISGVVAGTPKNRKQIIENILNHINVPHRIATMPYPIDYPLPKNEGNWIQLAGAIADSAGYYLRCDTFGVVIANQIGLDFDGGSSAETYLVGRDEKLWESIGDVSEQPTEKLIVSGVKQVIVPVDFSPSQVTDYQPIGALFPDAGYRPATNLAVSKRTTKSKNLIQSNLYQYYGQS